MIIFLHVRVSTFHDLQVCLQIFIVDCRDLSSYFWESHCLLLKVIACIKDTLLVSFVRLAGHNWPNKFMWWNWIFWKPNPCLLQFELNFFSQNSRQLWNALLVASYITNDPRCSLNSNDLRFWIILHTFLIKLFVDSFLLEVSPLNISIHSFSFSYLKPFRHPFKSFTNLHPWCTSEDLWTSFSKVLFLSSHFSRSSGFCNPIYQNLCSQGSIINLSAFSLYWMPQEEPSFRLAAAWQRERKEGRKKISLIVQQGINQYS